VVEHAWALHRDPEAFELLIDHKPLAWLAEQINPAFEAGTKGRTLARAAIRLAPSVPSVLDRLFDVAPTSWAYASAKLGAPTDARRLRAVFDGAVDSDDRSLVVWSIGQLNQWDLLLELHQVPDRTLEQMLARRVDA
jgi:hypothetical protein